MRKQLVSGKKLLLFVDTGDNCRCPLAIGYLSKLLAQKNIDYIDLRHMGVMTPNDLLPTPEVVQLLKEEGVDIRYHRSRPVNDDLIRQADLVLGFTAIHVQTCLRRVPESKGKVFLLKQYVGLGHTGDQIHDPMGSTMEIFKKYFSDIKQSLNKLVEMEFITEPPEPKEMVIAPAVPKSRSQMDEEDEAPAKRRPRKTSAADEDSPAPSRKAGASDAEDSEAEEKPAAKKKASKAAAPADAEEKPASKSTRAKAGTKATAADKKATAKTTRGAKSADAEPAEDEPAKKEKAGKAKKASSAGDEPAKKVKVAGTSSKKTESAPKVAAAKKSAPAAKSAAPKAKASDSAAASKSAKAPAAKAAATKKAAPAKPAAKSTKSKK